jgi:hypothetical protein
LLANRQLAELTRQQKHWVSHPRRMLPRRKRHWRRQKLAYYLQRALISNAGSWCVLLGLLPGDALPAEFTLAQLQLPSQLPLSIPSELLERRPDIRIAESQLQAANAQVGVAGGASAESEPDRHAGQQQPDAGKCQQAIQRSGIWERI